jgi:spermidine synthase
MLLTDQKSLAHVPMLFLKNPKSALTVGFGSGGASYSYSLYPELTKIRCVEITKTVPQAAPYLQDSNKGIIYSSDPQLQQEQKWIDGLPAEDPLAKSKLLPLWEDEPHGPLFKSDPRYGIILDDARSYLRFTADKYDIIATDCTDLRYKSNANLYDLQYFELCRERITDDGMVVVWMPLGGLSDAAMKVALRTFYKVFPEMEVFYMNNQPTHYVLLLGTKHPLKVDIANIRRRLQIKGVSEDLAEIKLNDPAKILSCFVTGGALMKPYLDSNPVRALNTEDTPYLEFESPRYGYGDEPLLDNLDELFRYEGKAMSLVQPGSGGTSFSAELDQYRCALPSIIEGHREYRELHLAKACRDYMKALEINPADSAVKELLNFEELRRKAVGQPESEWSYFMLGQLMNLQGRSSEAVTYLNTCLQAIDNDPDSNAQNHTQQGQGKRWQNLLSMQKGALLTLSDIYYKAGQNEKAATYNQNAATINAPYFRVKESF